MRYNPLYDAAFFASLLSGPDGTSRGESPRAPVARDRRLGKRRRPLAVIGGNAVAAWVARVDEAAVRVTPDVDILLRRADMASARNCFEKAGFVYKCADGIDMFLDGPNGKSRDAVHIVYANDRVRPEHQLPAPDVAESECGPAFQMLNLEALVQMKLTSYRLKDRVHIRDMLDVGLLDSSWLSRLPADLAARLQQLIDTPEG
jgi:hypothetical protein